MNVRSSRIWKNADLVLFLVLGALTMLHKVGVMG